MKSAGGESVVAIDLGASSGRCLQGTFDGKRLAVQPVYRFPNRLVRFNGHLRWNVVELYREIVKGLGACAQARREVRSIGVDTWGVDFALLGPDGALLDLPVAYRDARTAGCMEEVSARIGRARIYAETGIQFLPFNTLYQLYALRRDNPKILSAARRLLMMPDLFAFLLTGVRVGEYTDASTTQILNAHERTWSSKLIKKLDFPRDIFPELVQPGTSIGPLLPDVVKDTGLKQSSFVATATHDTASAVAGVPASGTRWAYISCGTWSLVGCERPGPLTSSAAWDANFTNEGGVAGTIRFLKNVQGMWMLQECQKEWAASGNPVGSAELTRRAASAPAFAFLLDPDDPCFLSPASMLQAIAGFCRRTGQRVTLAPPTIARAILESLAVKHRNTIRTLAGLTGDPVEVIHLIGGGSRNRLLCQWTADASGVSVKAGPAEATAIGNILVQGIALGWFRDLQEARRVLQLSVRPRTFLPAHTDAWDAAEEKFLKIVGRARSSAAHA